MKLTRITKPLRSAEVRVTLAGEVNATLEDYARYHEHIHGDPVESDERLSLRCFAPGMVTFPLQWPPAPCRSLGLCLRPRRRRRRDHYSEAFADALGQRLTRVKQ